MTQVVELTPSGRAAVAVVLVVGPQATDLVGRCFRPISHRPLGGVPLGRIALGRWGGVVGEELIVCRRAVDRVEVHCHGGSAAVRAVVDRLVAEGCRHVAWQDWLRQTEGDPIRAAARVAIADAPAARTAGILLDQYQGALGSAIREVIEAASAERWPGAIEALDAILAYRDVGQHLVSPWRVVLAGPPNVGKSSLLNALAGFQRAIVSELPGTTRDVVTLSTAIDGWPVHLSDTAGLREAGDELEAAGIDLASGAIADADLLIAVDDCTAADGESSAPISQWMKQSTRVIDVRNKVDLLKSARPGDAGGDCIFTSATTGEGIARLIEAIGRALVPNPPVFGAAVPFDADQLAVLDLARRAVEQRDGAAARTVLQSLIA